MLSEVEANALGDPRYLSVAEGWYLSDAEHWRNNHGHIFENRFRDLEIIHV